MSMTKEKEEVIKRLEKLVELRKNKAEQIKYDNCICATEDLETVLNMLKEKDKEINSKSSTIKALQCALHERTEERDRKDYIIARQKKQIDLMAEEINNNFLNTCPYIDYEIDLNCENRCNDDYKECWKQYFESKAEKE